VFQFSAFRQALCALPLAWLWFILINDLRVEWTVNPQYSYGWAVPFLCAFLIWQRVQKAESRKQKAKSGNAPHPGPLPRAERELPSAILYFLFAVCALLYTPTRLIEVANPGWRLMSWALAIEIVGLTLIFIRLALGSAPPTSEVRSQKSVTGNQPSDLTRPLSAFERFSVSDFVFPVCFFLVAVPWPSPIEGPLIQGLTRVDTACTAELLGWFGIPAMPHGNVIEVATGMVGIDEACSGIRSFQATLMISLFLGEFYSLGILRRVVCVFAGFALSFLFNLARMSLLVWVAARKGVAAIASWHDPAGVTILVACFFCLWGLGVRLQGKRQKQKGKIEEWKVESENLKPEGGGRRAEDEAASRKQKTENKNKFLLSAFQIPAFALAVWILLTEFSVEAWYRSHEAHVPAAAQWTVAWPVNNPAFKELPLPEQTRQILRYDEGRSASWEASGFKWQAVFFRWKPGRTAIHLAQNHTPEICLTGAGYTLNAISPQEWFEVNGLRMPFLAYQVTDAPQPFFVFYCLWDDRANAQGFETMGLTYGNRLAPVLAGQRNPGQRSLEIAVTGPDNAAEAEAAVHAELERLITSKP
jgi:exosortase/archaeosortase family protein